MGGQTRKALRMDVLTPQQRHRCMAAIRGKDTKPEMVVRRLLTAMGYRYRLHDKNMPGRPDIIFRSRRAVVFVHGCYWHRHTCAAGRVLPKTRLDFWQTKLEANAARDKRNCTRLRRDGWRVLIVWECQLRDTDRLERRLHIHLGSPGAVV